MLGAVVGPQSATERHKLYISEHEEDMPERGDWPWTS
jgi:hypothetical protein